MAKVLPAVLVAAIAIGFAAPSPAADFIFRYRAGGPNTGASQGPSGGSQTGGGGQTGGGTTTPGGGTQSPDLTPSAVTFATLSGQTVGAPLLSEIRQLTDHDGVDLSVSGGSSAALRICSDASCSSSASGWVGSATAARDAYVQLRRTAPAAGTTATASLSYGTLTATWQVQSAAPVTCPGDYMRMKLSTGFEALVCGLPSAPPNVVADARTASVWLVSNSADGCYYQTNSIMYLSGSTGELLNLVQQGTSQYQNGPSGPCEVPASHAEFWFKATGMAYPLKYIMVSKGTPPTGNMYSQTITWSK